MTNPDRLQNNSSDVGMVSGGVEFLVAKPIGFIFNDLSGTQRIIRGCSLTKLRELSSLVSILWRETNTEIAKNKDISLQEIFLKNTLFQQISLRCLELCSISPDWIDVNMLIQMLFPFEFEGSVADGLILQINFPKSASPSVTHSSSESRAKMANWDDMLASLWVGAKSIKDAVEVAKTEPWNTISPAIAARNEMYMSQEDREKKETLDAYAELLKQPPNGTENAIIKPTEGDADDTRLNPLMNRQSIFETAEFDPDNLGDTFRELF